LEAPSIYSSEIIRKISATRTILIPLEDSIPLLRYIFDVEKDLNELIYSYLIMFKEKCPQCGQGDLIGIEKTEKKNVEVRKFSCGHKVISVISDISSELGVKSRMERGLEHRKEVERGSKRYRDSGKRKKGKGI